MEIITLKQALETGSTTYKPNYPCSNGHFSIRYVGDYRCFTCVNNEISRKSSSHGAYEKAVKSITSNLNRDALDILRVLKRKQKLIDKIKRKRDKGFLPNSIRVKIRCLPVDEETVKRLALRNAQREFPEATLDDVWLGQTSKFGFYWVRTPISMSAQLSEVTDNLFFKNGV